MESGERGRQLFAVPAGIALSEATVGGRGEICASLRIERKDGTRSRVPPPSTQNPAANATKRIHSYQGALLRLACALALCGLVKPAGSLASFPQQQPSTRKAKAAGPQPSPSPVVSAQTRAGEQSKQAPPVFCHLLLGLVALIPCVCASVRLVACYCGVGGRAKNPDGPRSLPARAGRLLYQFDFGEEHPKKQPF